MNNHKLKAVQQITPEELAEQDAAAWEVSNVWAKITNAMDAELHIFDVSSGGVVTTEAVLSSLRQVESDRAFERRTQNAEKPRIRACGEPFLVSVALANPLGIQLELTEIHLVAELQGTQAVGSNEGLGVSGDNFSKTSSSRTWSFDCCPSKVFRVPAFYCDNSISNRSVAENEVSPYFCVEEKSVTMDGSSVLNITLAICPLIKGEFNILGLRCKLFDQVWMYHPFFVQGPLLQDTRQHKANRVRGPRSLLKSIITRHMPLLKIDMKLDADELDAGCSMIQGEVSKGYFRIRNVGHAPAHRVFLKTNYPWICFFDKPESPLEQITLERMSTSYCVGPSGTLMKLPIKDVLEPGDTADVAFRLKASGGGKQELYPLFSYEHIDQHAVSTAQYSRSNGVRTVKHVMEISVYPSLSVIASIMPSFWDKKENVLSVEVSNVL